LLAWAGLVRKNGLQYTQTLKGFHDEPLKGNKKERRSIRLSKQWRAEYTINQDGNIEFVLVEEVHPHDY
jgi:proteic killer suppression protein